MFIKFHINSILEVVLEVKEGLLRHIDNLKHKCSKLIDVVPSTSRVLELTMALLLFSLHYLG